MVKKKRITSLTVYTDMTMPVEIEVMDENDKIYRFVRVADD